MSETGTQTPVTELSYEDARDELVRVVSRLESGGVNLEESLALWERGETLAEHCRQWLEGARRRVEDAVAAHEPQEPEPQEAAGQNDG